MARNFKSIRGKPKDKIPVKLTKVSKRTPQKSGLSKLSNLASSDLESLLKNSTVLKKDSSEQQFLKFVKLVKVWKQKWQNSEIERQKLHILLQEKSKITIAMDQKIKQAKDIIDDEHKKRNEIEASHNLLKRQWEAVQDILDVNEGVLSKHDFEDISQRTRRESNNFHVRNHDHESLVNASDLSFTNSKMEADILEDLKNESSVAKKKNRGTRRTRSILAKNDLLVKSPILDRNAAFQMKPTILDFDNFEEKLKDFRKSRENALLDEKTSSPILEKRINHKKHDFVKKMALREKCDVCQKRFKFGKQGLKCQTCGLVFHPYCFDEKNSILCQIDDERLPMKTSTPTTPSELMMPSKAKRKNKSRLEQSLFESPMLD